MNIFQAATAEDLTCMRVENRHSYGSLGGLVRAIHAEAIMHATSYIEAASAHAKAGRFEWADAAMDAARTYATLAEQCTRHQIMAH